MRRAVLAALVAACALWPGCLCIAEFPDALLAGDSSDAPVVKDGPGRLDRDGRLPEGPGLERSRDARRDARDLPRAEALKPDLMPARADLHVTGKDTPTCGASGAVCKDGTHCVVTGTASCTGLIDCGNATICEVKCSGIAACAGGVNCNNAKQCFVTCDAGACGCTQPPCTSTIECGKGTYCDIRCTNSSCAQAINCNGCGCLVSCDSTSCGGEPNWDRLFCPCAKNGGTCACLAPPCANP